MTNETLEQKTSKLEENKNLGKITKEEFVKLMDSLILITKFYSKKGFKGGEVVYEYLLKFKKQYEEDVEKSFPDMDHFIEMDPAGPLPRIGYEGIKRPRLKSLDELSYSYGIKMDKKLPYSDGRELEFNYFK